MKKFLSLVLVLASFHTSCLAALQLEDLKDAKSTFYRLGTTDTPEIKVDFDVKPTIQPVVKKEIKWSKRCKDKSLIGTTKK